MEPVISDIVHPILTKMEPVAVAVFPQEKVNYIKSAASQLGVEYPGRRYSTSLNRSAGTITVTRKS